VKINAVPIEAYRQTAGAATRHEATAGEQAGAERPDRPETVTISNKNDAAAPRVRATVSPSLLEGVLSVEEKNELIRHFARFGDAGQEARLYGAGSRTESASTGIRVDLTA
jgi:hypothetical protein